MLSKYQRDLLNYLAESVQRRQISQSQVAENTGVHQSQISRVLAGRFKRASPNALKLCKYASDLRGGEPTASPAEELSAALNRIWDGTTEHAQALVSVLDAVGRAQDGFNRRSR